MSDYDDSEFRAKQAEKARKLQAAADVESAARLRATIAESQRNERENPAVAAAMEHAPVAWTAEQEAELVANIYGTEAERIAKMLGRPEPQN